MSKIICSPGEYIQGKGEMKRLADYYESAARKGLFLVRGAYMIVDSFFSTEQYKKQITESFQKKNIPFSFNVFGGECCMKEIIWTSTIWSSASEAVKPLIPPRQFLFMHICR